MRFLALKFLYYIYFINTILTKIGYNETVKIGKKDFFERENTMKKIIRPLILLITVLGILLSTTSCFYTISVLTNSVGIDNDTSSNTGTDGGSGTLPDTNGGTDKPSSGTGEGSTEPDEIPSIGFHPETNNPEDIAGLRPEVRALLSTVAIVAKLDIKSSYPYAGDSTTEYTSYGSGVIYKLDRETGDAYILTNYHVVYNSGEVALGGFSDGISLYLYGMEEPQYAISATVVGGSMTYDLAVLKVEGSEVLKNSIACEAILGDSENVRVYDTVYAVGNPEGYGISATEGSVNVETEQLQMTGADGKTAIALRVMRVSAAINDGNSGGGLYAEDGKLIGIVNAKRTGAEVDNIGYAIPINQAKNVAENILKNCDGLTNLSVKKCVIGITLVTGASGVLGDGSGNLIIVSDVVVDSIQEGCITDKVLAGDIINSVTIDGNKTEVTRTHHIIDAMLKASVGSSITMNITRGTETFDITLTVPEAALTTVK